MISGKQKRAAIMARRHERREQAKIACLRARAPASPPPPPPPRGSLPVDVSQLAPHNSWGSGLPRFAQHGYYVDQWYACVDCGKHEVWTAAQQKWWYETAKGYIDSIAIRCKPCRVARRSGRTVSKKNNDNNKGSNAS